MGGAETSADVAVFCLADSGRRRRTGSVGGGGQRRRVRWRRRRRWRGCRRQPARRPNRAAAARCAPTAPRSNCALGPAPIPNTDSCCALESSNDRLLCAMVYACFVEQGLYVDRRSDGRVSAGLPGRPAIQVAPNGPCVSEVEQAAKTVDPAMIQNRWVSSTFPIGRAVNLVVCRGSFCPEECAIH